MEEVYYPYLTCIIGMKMLQEKMKMDAVEFM